MEIGRGPRDGRSREEGWVGDRKIIKRGYGRVPTSYNACNQYVLQTCTKNVQ